MKNKILRSLISLLLMTAIIFTCSGFTASSYSRLRTAHLSDGVSSLNSQFEFGVGEQAGGHILDYLYYQPKNGGGSYPLVIWLHGLGHGAYPGDQLTGNDISKWTSVEYQSKFENAGGAYILCPRAPENNRTTWWSNGMEKALMALIKDFVEEHPDIDTSRIYIGGFSLGGYMTIEMCNAYPDYFAAAFVASPAAQPFVTDYSAMADIPIWVTACETDTEVPYPIVTMFWDKLMDVSTVAGSCRLSVMTEVMTSSGEAASSNHRSWEAVTADMFTDEGGDYYNMTTENGKGKEITLTYPNGLISWLSSKSN